MYLLFYCILVFVFKQKTAYEMRISDWSSDVCSSDLLDVEVADLAEIEEALVEGRPLLHAPAVDVVGQVVDDGEAGARRTLVGARQRLEVDVVDRAVVAVAIDQVDERIADALDGGDVQLHRPGRRLDHPGAHRSEEHPSELPSLMRTSYA